MRLMGHSSIKEAPRRGAGIEMIMIDNYPLGRKKKPLAEGLVLKFF